jgi:bacteriocin-like protein
MTEETAMKAERDPKDQELTKDENEELTHEELAEVSGGFIVRQ